MASLIKLYNFYRDLNPATLSGAIDVIVVNSKDDNELRCSPFHVRFGKLKLLLPQEKTVSITVNNELVDLHMKLGDQGEAFFVVDAEGVCSDVDSDYWTSPIIPPVNTDNTQVDPLDLEDYVSAVGSETSSLNEKDEQQQQSNHQEADSITNNTLKITHKSTPKTVAMDKNTVLDESIFITTPLPSAFQTPAKQDTNASSMKPFQRTRSNSAVYSSDFMSTVESAAEKSLHDDAISDTEFELQKATEDSWTWGHLPKKKKNSLSFTNLNGSKLSLNDVHSSPEPSVHGSPEMVKEKLATEAFGISAVKEETMLRREDALIDQSLHISIENEVIVSNKVTISSEGSPLKGGSPSRSPTVSEVRQIVETMLSEADSQSSAAKTLQDSPNKDQMRLILNIDADLESDALNNDFNPSAYQSAVEPNSLAPWKVGTELIESVNNDKSKGKEQEGPSKKESTDGNSPDQTNIPSYTASEIKLSLCGPVAALPSGEAITLFDAHAISYEAYWRDPLSILQNIQLIVKLGDRYLPYQEALPLLVSQVVFGQYQKQTIVKDNKAVTGKTLTNRYSAYFKSWFSSKSQPEAQDGIIKGSTPSSPQKDGASRNDGKIDSAPVNDPTKKNEPISKEQKLPQLRPKRSNRSYIKSLRLTSDQLKSLKLKAGMNTVTFSVNSEIQGTASCSARIFLWECNEKIVISDIDGTITKSDALGHIFTMVGKDWTHLGVANLYTNIYENGYKIMYLTSRAIGQAEATRDYLKKVEQGRYQLPDGPVIMSPDRLLSAIHREVILRKPQEFKMACLKDIMSLFESNPFYAGFGNRITDALSYMSVDIPASRIFTIDSTGEVKLELLFAFKSSYLKLNDLVDHIFPSLTIQTLQTEFTDFNFWKHQLPVIDIFQESPSSDDDGSSEEDEYSDDEENDE